MFNNLFETQQSVETGKIEFWGAEEQWPTWREKLGTSTHSAANFIAHSPNSTSGCSLFNRNEIAWELFFVSNGGLATDEGQERRIDAKARVEGKLRHKILDNFREIFDI